VRGTVLLTTSVTEMVTVNVPFAVGVPVRRPPVLMVSPAGRPEADHV
jgi:hypothetical protein